MKKRLSRDCMANLVITISTLFNNSDSNMNWDICGGMIKTENWEQGYIPKYWPHLQTDTATQGGQDTTLDKGELK